MTKALLQQASLAGTADESPNQDPFPPKKPPDPEYWHPYNFPQDFTQTLNPRELEVTPLRGDARVRRPRICQLSHGTAPFPFQS